MESWFGVTVATAVVVGAGALFVFLKKNKSPKQSSKDTSRSLEVDNTISMENKVFLNKQRQKVPLSEKIQLSHDTFLFRFSLPTKDTVLGLPIGKHFKIFTKNFEGVEKGKWNGRDDPEADKDEIQRSYTPTSSDDDKGHFDLVIKVYKRGVVDRFPDGGKVSQYLDSLAIGDEIDISGPFGLIEYKGRGVFSASRKDRQVKHVGMIAGGTGITPMLQIINAVLKDTQDNTKLSLLFANQSTDDILVRDELEKLANLHPDRFSLWYTLDRPPVDWKYSTGFVDKQMITEHLPAASEDTVILMCGPPPMINFACKPNLEQLGFSKESMLVF